MRNATLLIVAFLACLGVGTVGVAYLAAQESQPAAPSDAQLQEFSREVTEYAREFGTMGETQVYNENKREVAELKRELGKLNKEEEAEYDALDQEYDAEYAEEVREYVVGKIGGQGPGFFDALALLVGIIGIIVTVGGIIVVIK